MVPNLKSAAGSVRIKNEEIILEAAKKEFVAHGFRGASIKSIAERAGIPRANIHYYFEDKTEIFKR
jgi:TetR/AcrR family transcriptional regulator